MVEVLTAIIGAVATVVAAMIGVRIGRRPAKEDPRRSHSADAVRQTHRYDVFVSSPLAGYGSDDEVKAEYNRIMPVVQCLEDELDLRVFWAGLDIKSKGDFDDPGLSAIDDIEALKASKYFLLFYPRPVLSSVLYEAGVALRSCLVSVYIVQDRDHLPFLMVSASEVFSNVRLYKASWPDETLALLRNHGVQLFA